MANITMHPDLDPMIVIPPTLDSRSKEISPLIEKIKETAYSPSPKAHLQLLGLIDRLRLAVETPTETVLRLIYQPPQNAALRIVVDLKIFPLLLRHGKASAEELATWTKAERGLIIRLMRVVTALGLCESHESGIYQSTKKTSVMNQSIAKDGVACIYDLTVPTLAKLPEYFRVHGYACPKEYSKSPMRWAVGQGQFEWLADRKDHQALFNSYMSSRRQGKPNWFDVYPVEERLMDQVMAHEDAVFMVDVGGNQGGDLLKFHERFPSVPGRLVLEDLPGVVSCSNPAIKTMEYNFLYPQPVKGARTYYFRAILHDWPDHVCHQILLNTVSAMKSGYSSIIIVDIVLPDTDALLLQAALDIQMMSIGAGLERSKSQWLKLLHGAGLEIKGIWNISPGMESVIEAVQVRPGEVAIL